MQISWRRRAGRRAGALLSLGFALLLVPVTTAEHVLGLAGSLVVGEEAPITIREPGSLALGVHDDGEPVLGPGRVILARGDLVTPERVAVIERVGALRPPGPAGVVGLVVAFSLLALLFTTYLRGTQRGRLLRVQLMVLVSFVLMAAATKALLLFTPLSWFVAPAAAVALLVAVVVDRHAGIGAAVTLGLVLSALQPFDAAVAVVLGAQGVGAVLALGGRTRKPRAFLVAGAAGALAAVAAYVATYFVRAAALPADELTAPLHSPLGAALVGGLVAGPLAVAARGLVERIAGDVPRSKLVELTDLDHPLLRQIATQAPGTWQHSLAMANMAEIVANAIGANALLVRVGAYFHDVGKSLQPQFYIENQVAGQPSPHDSMRPEHSADSIFDHVVEGVRLARARGLPEAVVDFIHMHHGDGVLEYFWGKCQEHGNPRGLPMSAFRYPGVRPQSKETAILAICDAVEAASRTLRQPDARAIESLVQRIVYGKLHLGQLDDSGLSLAELKVLASTLVEILKHAHHVRIEYPWQKEERARQAGATPAVATAPGANPSAPDEPAAGVPVSATITGDTARHGERRRDRDTGRFFLDSADILRPLLRPTEPVGVTKPMRAVTAPPDAAADVAVPHAVREVADDPSSTTGAAAGRGAAQSPRGRGAEIVVIRPRAGTPIPGVASPLRDGVPGVTTEPPGVALSDRAAALGSGLVAGSVLEEALPASPAVASPVAAASHADPAAPLPAPRIESAPRDLPRGTGRTFTGPPPATRPPARGSAPASTPPAAGAPAPHPPSPGAGRREGGPIGRTGAPVPQVVAPRDSARIGGPAAPTHAVPPPRRRPRVGAHDEEP